MAKLKVEIKNELYKPEQYPEVIMRSHGGEEVPLFNVRVFVDGPMDELQKIDHVVYKLHPTFPDPIRTGENQNDNFEIITWAWGEFWMEVEIVTKTGKVHRLKHRFEFSDQVRTLASQGIPFIDIKTKQKLKFE